jgi:hypothetical protein
LIHLADKYGAKALIDAVDLSSVRSAVATNPPRLFGFAMAHGMIETARDALALFQKSYTVDIGKGTTRNQYGQLTPCDLAPLISGGGNTISGGLPHLLTDVPKADLARIPFEVMHELELAQIRVLLHGRKWASEAKRAKVSVFSLRRVFWDLHSQSSP